MLHIVLQYGDFWYEGSFWSGLLTSLLGALIGSATAIALFFYEGKRVSDNQEQLRKNELKNYYQYLDQLVKDIIAAMSEQKAFIKEYADLIAEKPFEVVKLKIKVTNNLSRFIDKLDHQKLFDAYLQESTHPGSRVKNFSQLTNSTDLMYEVQKSLISQLRIYSKTKSQILAEYIESAQERLADIFYTEFDKLKASSEPSDQEVYKYAEHLLKAYYNEMPDPNTYEYIQNCFVEPILEMWSKYPYRPDMDRVGNEARKAKIIFNKIKSENGEWKEDFEHLATRLESSLDKLLELGFEK